jgi:hypothetical protein
MELSQLLESQSDEIINAACSAVERSHLHHYERDGADKTRERIVTLFNLTKQSVKDRNLAPMIAHAEQIARKRYTAGFDLWEVQTAFNVLEEAIWVKVFKIVPPDALAEALGLVSTILGAGKDMLARTYVSLASKTKAPSLNLQSLFSGGAE